MKKFDLLHRALIDFKLVHTNLDRTVEDDLFLDISAYHLQQGIEKTIKYYMSMYGKSYKKTHDILKLCEQLDSYSLK